MVTQAIYAGKPVWAGLAGARRAIFLAGKDGRVKNKTPRQAGRRLDRVGS